MINEISSFLLGEVGPGIKGNGSRVVAQQERIILPDREEAYDLFGDILDVQVKGISHTSFHMSQDACGLAG